MTIQEILTAQAKAAAATRKANPLPPAPPPKASAVAEIIAAQKRAAIATHKPTVAPPPPKTSATVQEIIARQGAAAAADKAARDARVAIACGADKAMLQKLNAEYREWVESPEFVQLMDNIKAFAGANQDGVFTPNIPGASGMIATIGNNPMVAGVSVGEEAGGDMVITMMPKEPVSPTVDAEPANETAAEE